MRIFAALVGLALAGLGVFWVVTAPEVLSEADVAGITGDAARGEQVFWATGCASCHMAEGAKGEAQLVLSGGQRFASAFGTFIAPNISSDPDAGIGGWSLLQLANAVTKGVSPDGQHYFPALPYAAYGKLEMQDMADLHAYLATLPADATPSAPHEVGFPFNIRRLLGGWKFLFLSDDYVLAGDLSPEQTRGRYIAEAMAHCGECHTPRNALGGLKTAEWLAGAANPDGKGRTPNISPGGLDWSNDDIYTYLTDGTTPEFDFVGGHMAHVVENLARLPEADRWAVVAYLKAVQAVP